MRSQVRDRLNRQPLPDLTGRRALITGASAGIGYATAESLSGAGADVILAVRSLQRGETAAERIRRSYPMARVSVEIVELASMKSIAELADRVGSQPLNLLINNAGLGTDDPAAVTEDGFDLQVGVNFLAAWALTAGLWPALCASSGRVVTLGSTTSARGHLGPAFGEPVGSIYQRYCDSKLATVVFADELRRRAQAAEIGVTAVPAHPGWCQTKIFDTGGPPRIVTWLGMITKSIQSPADGAQPILAAATEVNPGLYYGPTKHKQSAGPPGVVPLPPAAREPGIGQYLWEMSSRLTGLSIPLDSV